MEKPKTEQKKIEDPLFSSEEERAIIRALGLVGYYANSTARHKGFWEGNHSDLHYLAMMHGEISEAGEAMREIEPPQSEKIPDFLEAEEELADAIIRILDFANEKCLDVPGAVVAKMKYNETRPYKHGKKF